MLFLLLKNNDAQATVELAVMFPVIIIISVICINALSFFSICASFDRDFKQIVVSNASSPGYGYQENILENEISNQLFKRYKNDYLDFNIESQTINGNYMQYCAQLKMYPTLFGLGLKTEVFGCRLPVLTHTQSINIEQYKPGVIF